MAKNVVSPNKDNIVVWDYDTVKGKIIFTDSNDKNHSVKALQGINNLVCFKFNGSTYYLVPNDYSRQDYVRNIKKPRYSAWRQVGNNIVACYSSAYTRKLSDTRVRDGFTGYYPTPEEYEADPNRWSRHIYE